MGAQARALLSKEARVKNKTWSAEVNVGLVQLTFRKTARFLLGEEVDWAVLYW